MDSSTHKETKSLFLVLFGFLGSKPKHLKKYCTMFDGMHNATFLPLHPSKNPKAFWSNSHTKRQKPLAKYILNSTANFIERETKSNRSPFVIFYVFSQAGGVLLAALNDVLCDDKPYKVMFETNAIFINGIIYDSLPLRLDPPSNRTHMDAYFNNAYPMNARFPIVKRYLLFTVICCIIFTWWCLRRLGFSQKDDIWLNYFEKLLCKRNEKILRIPSLFLYSSADKSTPVEHITAFIQMKRNALK
eukprot:131718_1